MDNALLLRERLVRTERRKGDPQRQCQRKTKGRELHTRLDATKALRFTRTVLPHQASNSLLGKEELAGNHFATQLGGFHQAIQPSL